MTSLPIRLPSPGALCAGICLLLLQPLLKCGASGEDVAAAPAQVLSGQRAECGGADADDVCGAAHEEEFEEQAFLQTVQPGGRPTPQGAGTRAPRRTKAQPKPAAAPEVAAPREEPSAEEQALLQRFQRQAPLQPGVEPEGMAMLSRQDSGGGGAKAPTAGLADVKLGDRHGVGEERAPQGVPQARAAAAPEGPWRGYCLLAIGLGVWSLATLFGVGVYLKYRAPKEAKAEVSACKPDDPAATCSDLEEDLEEDGLSLRAQCATPLPVPRLPHVGTSFVVPLSRITECSERSLSLDVPVSPAVWPLRASLSRSIEGQGPWSRIDLTVDIIDAAGLPPLLSCGPPDALCPEGGSGGTGASDDKASSPTGCGAQGDGTPWLEIRGANGAVAALLERSPEGDVTVQRQGQAPWELRLHFRDGEEHWIIAYRRGKEVGLATRLARGKFAAAGDESGEYFQIDTQQDTSSPESVLLLMSILAMLVFQSEGCQ